MANYKQLTEKKNNMAAILQLLRRETSLTRQQIKQGTSLSWGCVSELTAELLARNLIIEKKTEQTNIHGRPPSLLSPNPQKQCIGIDINASKLYTCICDFCYQIIARTEYETDTTTQNTILKSIMAALHKETANRDICAIGVAVPGLINKDGTSRKVPSFAQWNEINIKKILESEFQLPVIVRHDPDCMLYAFSHHSAEQNILMVRIDEGIGAALRINGRFFGKGVLELGHMVMNPDGPSCPCGHRGCLETYASLRGLEKSSGLPIAQLAAQAEKQDQKVLELFRNMGMYLGIALGNLCNLIDIDNIVLSGKGTAFKPFFLKTLTETLSQTTLHETIPQISCFDETNAAFGAAKLAVANYIKL